jgi:hypothetical protein
VTSTVNDKVYIHEYIAIIGQNRAKYMHHMLANWSPVGQDERDQLCYGVWGTVGSTRRWPETINIWEEQGLDGLATSFRYETGHATLQDPKLIKWWGKAAEFRSGGFDRILAPAPWTRTIEELCADEVGGEAYAHEQVTVAPGRSAEYLEIVRQEAAPVYEEFGWELAGAWETLMTNDSECIFVWVIPTWEQWSSLEQAWRTHPPAAKWRARMLEETTSLARFAMVDAPLCPFRTHRQPARSDRVDWEE